MQSFQVRTVTIPLQGNSVAMADLPTGMSLRAVQTPVDFEGTTLTFAAGEASPGAPMFDGSSQYSLTSGPNRYLPIPKPDYFLGIQFLKITSNVSGSPSNVMADRTLKLFFASE